MRERSEAQLRNGAQAIAYRTHQLSLGVVLLLGQLPRRLPEPERTVVARALVESGLSNARALAYFLGSRSRRGDVHVSEYNPNWSDDDISELADEIGAPISRHLGHASYGAEEGELHPGSWPLPELACVLVGGVARLVEGLDVTKAHWFDPSPLLSLETLAARDPLSAVSVPVSSNPSVGRLTNLLRQHLGVG